jgi:Tol biopolymer transport system component/DNA-binding winged helix-turn-helix (wHTH) protein
MKEPIPKPAKHFYSFGAFRLYVAERELFRGDEPVTLSLKTFDTLLLLLRRHGHVVDRDELMKSLWPDTFVEEDNLVQQVSHLRKALGVRPDGQLYIETVPRRGYRFAAPVTESWEEESDSVKLAPAPPAVRRALPLRVMVAAAVLLAAVATWYLLRRAPAPQPPMRVAPLTSYPGSEEYPCFSPDGNQVAFSWTGEKQDNTDIYVKVIGTEATLRLTTHPAVDNFPAWTPDGRSIAFLRQTSPQTAAIYRVAPLGGSEREVADVTLPRLGGGLCWTRNGKWILSCDADAPGRPTYIVLVSSETGEKRKLTAGEGLGESYPALSPDNRILAFARRVADQQSLLFLLPLDAELKPTAAARPLRPAGFWNLNPVWIPDGKSLLFISSDSATSAGRLWRISVSGDSPPAPVPEAGEGVLSLAISPQGKRLVFAHFFGDSNIWQLDVSGPGDRAGTPRQVVASTREDARPAFSPDGGRIAFQSNRSGNFGVWLANADGSNPQLLHLCPNCWSENPVWSPDGRTIAFDARQDKLFQVYLISPEGGAPRRLTNHPSDNFAPSWSRDGRWIYFVSNRTGRSEVWKAPAAGGEAAQLTRKGGFRLRESPDGRTLFFGREGTSRTSLWKMPVEGGEESKVLDSVGARNWALVDQGLWFIDWTDPGDAALQFLEFATGKVTTVAPISKPPASGLAVSPDGRTILYVQYDHRGSELMLMENAL